jgi:hypothetical protein
MQGRNEYFPKAHAFVIHYGLGVHAGQGVVRFFRRIKQARDYLSGLSGRMGYIAGSVVFLTRTKK